MCEHVFVVNIIHRNIIRPIGNGSQLILKSASDASGTRREDMTVNQAVPVLAKK